MASTAADSVFHAGEQAAQERAGVRGRIEQVGRHMIRDFMLEPEFSPHLEADEP